ncbi:hypothetical protein M409DRAFT_62129 [Zasmidium cellare ATCC 36951]|uniref:Alpha-carbonic anhydrase domain-containing protein n=1 Tax=Zasmidium cellare ATCC 36951 TaxID=1080233 RepID=A0A6A6D6F3_ZASCE|nr:uncharacterized protein M409DRAFT_62129 [Zasmidium cellare ATCC 36951]KAF2173910.1 hypothetical protein M409DRAFT_62129 [Zasmidium cellare ATCC 36951]
MALFTSLRLLALSLSLASACPQLQKRQGVNSTVPEENRFFAYQESDDWGRLNPAWELCQTGTQQSPIPLRLDQGLSRFHTLEFNYPNTSSGDFHNWGYGPATTFLGENGAGVTSLPSAQFDENNVNETVYLASWHIHAPADHSVQGDRSKAELHLVHADAQGNERAVLAIRIDPGNSDSGFFRQLPAFIGFNSTGESRPNTSMNMNLALDEIDRFSDFWTYRGSLTSPPCTEGLRWFVARNIMFVSDEQMQDILRVSTFSARAEQEVWRHDINSD